MNSRFLSLDASRSWRPVPTLLTLVLLATACADQTTVTPVSVESGLAAGHLALLQQFNDSIRDLARTTPNTVLADVERHFFGHGISSGATDGYYFWPGSIIEPGARGASEIRRLWLQAIP